MVAGFCKLRKKNEIARINERTQDRSHKILKLNFGKDETSFLLYSAN